MIAVLLAAKSSGSSSILIIYAVLFAAFYFFYLRPRSKKQKAARLDARQVDVGERAQTIGGFVGTVVKKADDLVTLRGASGVELDFVPSAIAKRFDPVVPASSDDEQSTEGDDK
ncbi:MAG: preprotein translocase subunit YajC [Acidobacteriota bacterium]|nr:preprotein translocase subunit YajC [Acidobacteriota bacterium]MDE3043371.1 preprotein translocase subunit YajC [Acidobacteriota bacterium]MDE3106676.1 preprotein translocase subunit YajC [Acidobacteriota bacterium]MDE3223611.1 preprotein translocase subunit YajC [Acidobacteriota bacterium]